MTPDQDEIAQALHQVAQARHAGRPIVPLTGGGLSAESGAPTTEELIRYLAALRCYVAEGIYLPEKWRETSKHILSERKKDYEYSLLEFIKDYGWPDPNDLVESLWRAHPDEKWKLDDELVRRLDQLAEEIHPDRVAALGEAGIPNPRRSLRWDVVAHWTDLLRQVTRFNRGYAASLFTRTNRFRRPGLGHRFLAFLTRVCGMSLFLSTNRDGLLEQALTTEGIEFRSYDFGDGRSFPPPPLLREKVAVLNLFGQADRPVLDEQHELPLDEAFLKGLRQALPKNPLLLVLGCSGQGKRVMDLIERGFLVDEVNKPRDPGPAVVWLHYEDLPPTPVRRLYLKNNGTYRRFVTTAGVKSPGLFLRHLYFSLCNRFPASAEPYSALASTPNLLNQDPPLYTEGSKKSVLARYSNDKRTLVVFDNFEATKVTDPPASEHLLAWMNGQEGLTPIWIDLEEQYTIPGVVGALIDQCRLYDPMLGPSVLSLGGLDPDKAPDPTALDLAAERVAEALSRRAYAVAFDSLEAFAWQQTTHHGMVTPRPRLAESAAIEASDRAVQRLVNLLAGLFGLLERIVHGQDSKGMPLRSGKTALRSSRLAIGVNRPADRHARESLTPAQLEQRKKIAFYKDEFIKLCGPAARKEMLSDRDYVDPPPSDLDDPIPKRPSLRGILVPQRDDVPSEPPPLSGDKARLALLTLSCFRRTRTLVALRSVLKPLVGADSRGRKEEFGPASAVDSLLNWYSRQQYLTPIEGGMYWMNGPLRDDIYSANSRYTDTATVCQVFAPGGLKKPYETLAQLILLALHHDRIARHYYFETFIQSKDPHAFFEYVYHRVSSIRYLTKLDLLLAAFDRPRPHPVLANICRMLKRAVYDATPDYFGADPSSRIRLTDAAMFHREIKIRRAREIANLRIGWMSAIETLSAQVPAEQLISWCRWLIEDDLPRFCTAYYLRRAQEEEREVVDASVWAGKCKESDRRVFTIRSRLQDTFFSLWVACCRERGDDAAMRQVCGTRLRHLLEELEEWLDGPPADEKLKEVIQDLRRELRGFKETLKELAAEAASPEPRASNLLVPLIRRLFAAAPSNGGRKNAWKALWRRLRKAGNPTWPKQLFSGLLDLTESQLSTIPESSRWLQELERAVPKWRERNLYVRLILLQAEYHWRHISFHGRRVPSSLRANDPGSIEKLRQRTEKGFIAILRNDLPEQQALEQFSYFHYRTRLLLYHARSSWLSALIESAGPEQEELFKQAYRDLELARGRLDSGAGPTFLAQIDLAAAESALAQAGAEPDPPLARVGTKLDITDGYLRRALHHLLHGRRNVIRWREYHRLRAQYKAERNLWRLRELLESSPDGKLRDGEKPEEFWERRGGIMRRFIRTLRQGFLAIGYGRDLELPSGSASSRAPWLTTTYWELVFTALWMGVVILRWPFTTGTTSRLAPARDLGQLQDYVMDLAARSGVPPEEKPRQLQQVRKIVLQQLREGVLPASPRRRILDFAAATAGGSPKS
ncbi:MAG TPA: hypothetical protein VH643_04220 [Gemmataceae bacterium]|jgi:hypothetical protein